MLSFFRRHRGAFLFALTFIIIVSFSFWGGWKQSGGPEVIDGSSHLVTMFGTDYSRDDVGKMIRPQQLAFQIGMYDLFEIGSIVQQKQDLQNRVPYDLIANLITLRKAALEHGVAVSDEEAQAKLITLPAFQENGQFSLDRLKTFESNLGGYGMKTTDVLGLVKDGIMFQKLRDLISDNYTASSYEAEKSYQAKHQTIKSSKLTLSLADFKAKAQVKDEEISKYYDEKKDSYMTPEKRAASYVIFEKPKNDEKKTADENQKVSADFAKKANDFDAKFREAGSDIVALAKEFGLKVETAPLFERDAAPAALKEESKVVSAIFSPALKVGSSSKPVDGTKGYYFLKLTALEEPKQQELKDVKDKIKETLVAQKAEENLKAAANEAQKFIKDGLKAGKKLEDLAKEKGLKLEALPEFSPNNPPAEMAEKEKIAEEATWVAPGDVSKGISTDTGVILVAVTAKELRKSDQSASLKDSELTSASSQTGNELFKSWFSSQRRLGAEAWAEDPM